MIKKTKSLSDIFREAASSLEFEVDSAKLDFTDEMLALMKAQHVSRSELAHRLGVKPARITALLRGDNNFTLEMMIRICRALGVKYSHHLAEAHCHTHWFDVPVEISNELVVVAQGHVSSPGKVLRFPDAGTGYDYDFVGEGSATSNHRELALVS
jgi:transcriptional regulator with XRE-family HTH domain